MEPTVRIITKISIGHEAQPLGKMRFVRAIFFIAFLAWTVPASAQQTPATAVGTVFDSLRLKPLAGAKIRVDSSAVFATADNDGHFKLEGIPPGTHYLGVEHPLLDTLGIRLRSPTDSFAPGETVPVEIATPPAEGLIGLFCTAAW